MSTETVCPKCEGTGWIIRERAHLSGAERCDCHLQGKAQRLEQRANIPPNFEFATFENYRVPGPENPIERRLMTEFFMAVKKFAEKFPAGPKPGLLLIGEPGIGKTHLAVAVLKHIIATGHEGLYCNYVTLLHSIRAGYDEISNTADRAAYRVALESQVLLIDDLGAHRTSDWVEDTINSIITYRCDRKLPLIATTNCPDPDAKFALSGRKSEPGQRDLRPSLSELIGARARSRLFEMCQVIKAPIVSDFRIYGERQV